MFQNITMIDYKSPLSDRAKSRKVCGPYTWSPAKPGNGRGFYQAVRGLYCDPRGSTFKLRLDDAKGHLAGTRLANIDGYYCDSHGDSTLRPIVARLPHGRGFLAGWTMGAGMCASLDGYIWPSIEDAARAAHDMAEHDAEMEREREENDSADFE